MFVGILVVGMIVGVTTHATNAQTSSVDTEMQTQTQSVSNSEREQILWLARIIYSETKEPHEMALVGWVARNRVEAGFKGDTYKSVALSHKQFSGLNAGDHNYMHNITREYTSSGKHWENALSIAKAVYFADEALRPLPATVMHFYSPISMKGGRVPQWALGRKAVHLVRTNDNSGKIRFAFYESVN